MKHDRNFHCDIAIIVTAPQSVRTFFRGCIRSLVNRGWRVAVICGENAEARDLVTREGGEYCAVEFDREISPWRDARSLARLCKQLHRLKPKVILNATPKAGFLGSLAGFMCGIPVRIYGQFGLRMETCKGLKRWITWICERMAISTSTLCWCVSHSLRDAVVRHRLATASKLVVLGDGTSSGVEFERFSQPLIDQVDSARRQLDTSDRLPWIGFVGRLTKDKGIEDLYSAFCRLNDDGQQCRLLLVGQFEEGDPISTRVRNQIEHDERVFITGFVKDTAIYYPLIKMLVLPSYREGFPNVPLEAACAGLPTVGYDATGTVDAVIHGTTGILVPVGDVEGLKHSIRKYLNDELLRVKHGRSARERALRDFQPERIWSCLFELSCELLDRKLVSIYSNDKHLSRTDKAA